MFPGDFYTTNQELYKEMHRAIAPENKIDSIPSAQLAEEIAKLANNQNQNFLLEYQVKFTQKIFKFKIVNLKKK